MVRGGLVKLFLRLETKSVVSAGYQSHRVCFASPLGQGERIKVRGSGPPKRHNALGATLTLPLSLAKGEATLVRVFGLNTN
jgi:hypothetical protein